MKNRKPLLFLMGKNATTFNLMGMATNVLKAENEPEKADEMFTRCTPVASIDEVLRIIMEYVEVH